MTKTIPYVDLSRMLELPKCAVMVRSVDELENFFANAQKQISKYLYWDFDDILGLWKQYQDATGFTLFTSYDTPDSMSYCWETWFYDNGYEVIEFSELCNLPDIEESEMSLDMLFVTA